MLTLFLYYIILSMGKIVKNYAGGSITQADKLIRLAEKAKYIAKPQPLNMWYYFINIHQRTKTEL